MESQEFITIKMIFKTLEEAIKRLDKRINGTFDTIGTHIKEGEFWRLRIAAHGTKMKILTWVFSTLNILLIALLIKLLFFKSGG